MASRRRKPDEPGINLDSLMDALTNVVAVLILILILLQVDVSQTIEKLLGELKPASAEQIAAAEKEKQDLQRQITLQKTLLDAPAPKPGELAAINADLALIEKSVKDSGVKRLDLEKLRQLFAKTKAEADAEKKKTDTLLAEIQKLEALLDQTPVPTAPKSTIVRIPNSREVPPDANLYYCYVRGDQVYFVDPITAKEMVMREFNREERNLIKQQIKVPKGKDRVIYDQTKVVNFFAGKPMEIRGQKISVPFNKQWTALNVQIDLPAGPGDASLADMENPKGKFHALANKLSSFPKVVLLFQVSLDGFPTYLKAREIADQYRIPCGWEINGKTTLTSRLDFAVNNLETPPPSKPRTGPPPPKRQLD